MDAVDKLIAQVQKVRGPDVLKGIYINAWIYGSLSLSVKDREGDTSDESLKKLNGACGHRDIVFREVCDRLGWKSRRIGIHNIPIQVAHVGTEVWIDDDWRFFDPTFGVFLTKSDEPKNVLSLQKARESYPKVDIRRTKTNPFQGKWLKTVSPQTTVLEDKILNHPLGQWPLANLRDTYISSEIAYESNTDSFTSELVVQVPKSDPIELSGATLSEAHFDIGYGRTYFAYGNVIGLAFGRGPIVRHRLLILTEEDGFVDVSLSVEHLNTTDIHATIAHARSDFSLEGTHVDRSDSENLRSVNFRIPIRKPLTSLNLTVPRNLSGMISEIKISKPSLDDE